MRWPKRKRECPARIKCIVHDGTHVFHISYLSAATWEMHGVYSLAAGGLLAFILIGMIVGVAGGDS